MHGFHGVKGISDIKITKPNPMRAVVGMSQLSFLFKNIAWMRQSKARPATEISGRIEAQSVLRGANNLKASSVVAIGEVMIRKVYLI